MANTPLNQRLWTLPVTLLFSLSTAALFHVIPARAHAAWVVALLVPWGLLATLLPRQSYTLAWVLLAAVTLRLPLVGSPPWLSDDLYRYLFEGQVLLAGLNPFTHAPASLTYVDPALAAQVNHSTIPSIYPPVAQLWFRALALVGRDPWVAQLGTATVDVLNALLIHRILTKRALPTWPALVYAVHPLPVLEAANGAHLEPLAVACCLLVVYALDERPWVAVAAVGAGIGVKLLPVLFVPSLFRRLTRTQFLGAAGLIGTLQILLALPVLTAGSALFEAFSTYTGHWSFNGLLHPLFEATLGRAARPVLGLLGLAFVARATWETTPSRAWWWVGTGFLILSPTVHPWYVLWAFAPGLLTHRRGWALGAIALQSSYLVLASLDNVGGWAVPWWLGPLTWGGVGLGFLYARRLDSPTVP